MVDLQNCMLCGRWKKSRWRKGKSMKHGSACMTSGCLLVLSRILELSLLSSLWIYPVVIILSVTDDSVLYSVTLSRYMKQTWLILLCCLPWLSVKPWLSTLARHFVGSQIWVIESCVCDRQRQGTKSCFPQPSISGSVSVFEFCSILNHFVLFLLFNSVQPVVCIVFSLVVWLIFRCQWMPWLYSSVLVVGCIHTQLI